MIEISWKRRWKGEAKERGKKVLEHEMKCKQLHPGILSFRCKISKWSFPKPKFPLAGMPDFFFPLYVRRYMLEFCVQQA